MIDIKLMTIDDLVELVTEFIWSKKLTNSYEILEFLVEKGWKYDEHRFSEIIARIKKSDESVTYNNSDKLMICRPLKLDAMVLDYYKKSCYSCDFCRRIKNNYAIEKIFYDSSDRDRLSDMYCTLNPTLHIWEGRVIDDSKCPFNEALRKKEELNESI